MKIDSLKKLYVHELKDLYSAESQLIDALPEMIEASQCSKLKNVFREHLEQTTQHQDRIVEICKQLDFEPTGHKCKGMEGLIQEAEGFLTADIEKEMLDVALIRAAARMEHYEMAGYEAAADHAELLGETEACALLRQTLTEEVNTEEALCQLSKSSLNSDALTT